MYVNNTFDALKGNYTIGTGTQKKVPPEINGSTLNA